MVLITKTVAFLGEGIYGFISYLVVCTISAVAAGIQAVLDMGYDLKEVFGFDYKIFMPTITTISVMFLILLIMLDIAKSFSMVEDTEIKSVPEYMKRVVISFILMLILPAIINIFQLASEYFVYFTQKAFSRLMLEKLGEDPTKASAWDSITNAATYALDGTKTVFEGDTLESARLLLLLIFLIAFTIGFVLIGISLMKRFVELLIATMFIPFIAISVYKDYDKLNTWLSRVAQIFLGYMLNIFLIYVMLGLSIMILEATTIRLMITFFTLIAIISVAITGSQAIKEYVVSTGTAGQAGTLARTAESALHMRALKTGR